MRSRKKFLLIVSKFRRRQLDFYQFQRLFLIRAETQVEMPQTEIQVFKPEESKNPESLTPGKALSFQKLNSTLPLEFEKFLALAKLGRRTRIARIAIWLFSAHKIILLENVGASTRKFVSRVTRILVPLLRASVNLACHFVVWIFHFPSGEEEQRSRKRACHKNYVSQVWHLCHGCDVGFSSEFLRMEQI